MIDSPMTIEGLTSGAQSLVHLAMQKQEQGGIAELGLNHWLAALLERYGSAMNSRVVNFNADETEIVVKVALESGNGGEALPLQDVLDKVFERARQFAKFQPNERDIIAVVMSAAGYKMTEGSVAVVSEVKQSTHDERKASEQGMGSEQTSLKSGAESSSDFKNALSGTESASPEGVAGTDSTRNEVQQKRSFSFRLSKPIPVLEQFGRDLTQAAIDGKLVKVIGRDEEIQLIIETLCRRSKRNPVLVGPAGVGKTAIVEGLASRIVEGLVPDLLKGCRLIALQPSLLVAGASISGELEKRMKAVVIEASQDGIILFIDEFHSAIGAGGMVGTNDIASILKPSLARGELACIAATTNDEYRRFIEPDGALERRFQPIRVQELPAVQTLEVLKELRVVLSKSNQIQVSDQMLEWLVNFAQTTMRNRYFPDKAVDLLEQCYAHALTRNKKQIDLATAQEVAQRLIGMPVSLTVRLDALRTELAERSLLSEDDATQLLSRLQVTIRGLDMRSARPNAILLLSGEAAEGSSTLEEVIASAVFGAEDRVVKIDCSRFGHPEDINLLVGAPPGYVGYSDSLPIHRILQTPWCVLSFENIDLCNIQVREVITRAFEDGVITDGRGKAIYLSDTIVLLTAHLKVNQQQSLGFMRQESRPAVDLKQIAEASLGSELAAQVDLIAISVEERIENRRQWLEKYLLTGLTERYAKEGILLEWDSSVKDWLISQQSVLHGEREWERFIDEVLTPLLIPYLSSQPEQPSRILNIAFTTHLEISSV